MQDAFSRKLQWESKWNEIMLPRCRVWDKNWSWHKLKSSLRRRRVREAEYEMGMKLSEQVLFTEVSSSHVPREALQHELRHRIALWAARCSNEHWPPLSVSPWSVPFPRGQLQFDPTLTVTEGWWVRHPGNCDLSKAPEHPSNRLKGNLEGNEYSYQGAWCWKAKSYQKLQKLKQCEQGNILCYFLKTRCRNKHRH